MLGQSYKVGMFSPRWNINWRGRRYMNQKYVNPEVEILVALIWAPFYSLKLSDCERNLE